MSATATSNVGTGIRLKTVEGHSALSAATGTAVETVQAPGAGILASRVPLAPALIGSKLPDDMEGDTESEDDQDDDKEEDGDDESDGTPTLPTNVHKLAESAATGTTCSTAKLVASSDTAASCGSEKRKALMTQLLCVNQTLTEDIKEKRHKAMDANFDEVTFGGLLRAGNATHVLFHKEIRQRARNAGMASMSNEILEKYMFKIFGISAFKPTKIVNGKRKQARGYKCIRFARTIKKITNDVADGSAPVAMPGSASDSIACPPTRLHPNAALARGICQSRRVVMPASVLPHPVPASVLPRPVSALVLPSPVLAAVLPSPVPAVLSRPLPPASVPTSSYAVPAFLAAVLPTPPKTAVDVPRKTAVPSWQHSVMSKLQPSLGMVVSKGPGAIVMAPSKVSVSTATVCVVISMNRKGAYIIGDIVAGSSAALSGLVKVGAKIVMINDATTRGKSTEVVSSMMAGVQGTTVNMTLVVPGQIEHTVTLRRSIAVVRSHDVVTAPPRKVFVHGGLQDDRDRCIGRLLCKHSAYFIDEPSQSTLLAIAQTYSKSTLPKSIVVVKYEEKHTVTGEAVSAAHIAANKKLQTEAYEVARCLLRGYFWDEQQGQTVFVAPTVVIVVCNVQPYNRVEWEGWTFYNHGDMEA